ncbi:hypothetical protein Q4493_16945 [Colwellia sp. 1_MG-2023]|uniref:GAF domain-containing protein n=1 Tax=Colwellia sp. 1_MG-2023 TaxID=3062649 RepID=UPI0026E3EACA|nr:GAF domain-containing protein [Colwellia sp. 1_MG-2023]MDO6447462.1 hypothetical protein [Colwellia sp. 1_MG-2023]
MLTDYQELTTCISSPDNSTYERLQTICQEIKKLTPNVNRVSLWLFNQQANEIHCLLCLDSADQITNGQSLKKDDFPSYFDHILNNKVLSASNAREHPATSCFNEVYLKPLNIYSMLDFTFHFKFKPTGIICCEREGDATQWTNDNINALKRVANITSMFLSRDIQSFYFEKNTILDTV